VSPTRPFLLLDRVKEKPKGSPQRLKGREVKSKRTPPRRSPVKQERPDQGQFTVSTGQEISVITQKRIWIVGRHLLGLFNGHTLSVLFVFPGIGWS
jgi:hypothetical protein